jgi:hypothetical protein
MTHLYSEGDWLGTRQSRVARDEDMFPTFHSNKITAAGCFDRHDRARPEQELTERENTMKLFSGNNPAEREEQMIVNDLAVLAKKGFKIGKDETIEEFILNHQEVLR